MNFLFLSLFASSAMAEWETKPIIKPIISSSVYQAEEDIYVAAKVGGAFGLAYRQDGLAGFHGRTRGVYTQNFGSELGFREFRVGSFFGPKLGPIDLEIGADYMVDTYVVPNLYNGQFSAVSTPVRLLADVWIMRVELSAGPIFLLNTIDGDQRVGVKGANRFWGVGDEFAYSASARVGLGPLALGLGVSQRHTAYGTDNSVGLQFLILNFGMDSLSY
ncbi:MAG: hypothetical protein VX278_14190 [Myxococcota bacterium]|nr:hypothetical protein [Myxococcota bacterium]